MTSAVDVAIVAIHNLFAALWVGGVVFVALAVVPMGRDGDVDPDVLDTVAGRLLTLSRTSALLLLLTGGYLAGAEYTVDELLGTGRGWLVVAMVALWLALAGLVEVGSSRLRSGLDDRKLREPAAKALPLYRAAAVVGVLLVLDAAALSAGVSF